MSRLLPLPAALTFAMSFAFAQDTLLVVEQDYPAARALAAAEGKLLFVDFYTTWCRPCKELDRDIFRDETHGRRLGEDYVLLR